MSDKALLTCEDVARIMGLSAKTIRARCRTRRMFPQPIAWQRPYLFSSARLQRVLDGLEQTPPPPVRRGLVRRAAASAVLALALFAAAPAFAQTTSGGHYDLAALGLSTGFMGGWEETYPDFDFDGNRSTIELTEFRPDPLGGPIAEMRVGRVANTSPLRVCMGEWFNPITMVLRHVETLYGPGVFARHRLADLGGRSVIWYRTSNGKLGWLDIAIPAC